MILSLGSVNWVYFDDLVMFLGLSLLLRSHYTKMMPALWRVEAYWVPGFPMANITFIIKFRLYTKNQYFRYPKTQFLRICLAFTQGWCSSVLNIKNRTVTEILFHTRPAASPLLDDASYSLLHRTLLLLSWSKQNFLFCVCLVPPNWLSYVKQTHFSQIIWWKLVVELREGLLWTGPKVCQSCRNEGFKVHLPRYFIASLTCRYNN